MEKDKFLLQTIYGDITSKGNKVLVGHCPLCNGKKSMTVSDVTIVADRLGDFFNILVKKRLNLSEKMAKNVLKNARRACQIGANGGTAFASRSPTAALSPLPEVINFYFTGKRLHLGKFV